MKNEKLTASRPSPKLSRPPTRFVSPRMTRRASNPPLLASTNVQKQSPNAIHHNPNHESNTITPPLHYCGQLCQHPPSNPKIRTKHSNFSNSEQFRAIPTKCDLRKYFSFPRHFPSSQLRRSNESRLSKIANRKSRHLRSIAVTDGQLKNVFPLHKHLPRYSLRRINAQHSTTPVLHFPQNPKS